MCSIFAGRSVLALTWKREVCEPGVGQQIKKVIYFYLISFDFMAARPIELKIQQQEEHG